MCSWGQVSPLGAAVSLATHGLGIVPGVLAYRGHWFRMKGPAGASQGPDSEGRTFPEMLFSCPAGASGFVTWPSHVSPGQLSFMGCKGLHVAPELS